MCPRTMRPLENKSLELYVPWTICPLDDNWTIRPLEDMFLGRYVLGRCASDWFVPGDWTVFRRWIITTAIRRKLGFPVEVLTLPIFIRSETHRSGTNWHCTICKKNFLSSRIFLPDRTERLCHELSTLTDSQNWAFAVVWVRVINWLTHCHLYS